MSMVLPELWNKGSKMALLLTISHLKKYQHLINWRKNASIMEVGFATGKNSSQSLKLFLPNDYKEFVGSDISLKMVEYAKQHCNIPRSEIRLLDIDQKIPKEFQNRFDHVFGFNVIHFVKNPRNTFRNIQNLLKPGGTVFLSILERSPLDEIFDRLSRHPKWGKYEQEEMVSTYYHSENPGDAYNTDLKAAGFRNYVFKVEKDFYKFPTEQECYDLITSVNIIIPKIPKGELEEYLKDYLKELDTSQSFKINTENGKKCITMKFIYFIVVATKE